MYKNEMLNPNQIKIEGNFLEWYDEDLDGLEEGCSLNYKNCKLIDIDEEMAIFEVNEDSQIYELDSLGNIEQVIYEQG